MVAPPTPEAVPSSKKTKWIIATAVAMCTGATIGYVLFEDNPVALRGSLGVLFAPVLIFFIKKDIRAFKKDREAWRRTSFKAVAILFFVLGIGLEFYLYRDPSHPRWAKWGACFGIVVLIVNDVVVRPREATSPTGVGAFLAFWALVPVLCALAASAWLHFEQWDSAMGEVNALVESARPALCERTKTNETGWSCDPEQVQLRVRELEGRRFPSDASSGEAHQFHELGRVIGNDLVRFKGDSGKINDLAREYTEGAFWLSFAVQALFVLWIPFLLAVKIGTASKRLKQRRDERNAGSRVVPEDSIFEKSTDARDVRILGAERTLFLPRFCFGAFLLLGTNYIFAPYGLRASYIMSLVDERALPGHTSYTLWSTSFSAAPVIVVGFVGFFVYAIITATQRFMQDDLDDQAIFALLARGLVVILLSLALSSSPIDGTVSKLFVFIVGVFPSRALEAIAKRVNVSIDPDFEAPPKDFDEIPSLDATKVFALRAAGIQSSYDLAATPIEEIAARVRIDPRLLGRAVDRAILIEAIGIEPARSLAKFSIISATELVELKKHLNDAAMKSPEAAVKPSDATVVPETVVKDPEAVVKDPEAVVKDSEAVVKDPEAVVKDPDAVSAVPAAQGKSPNAAAVVASVFGGSSELAALVCERLDKDPRVGKVRDWLRDSRRVVPAGPKALPTSSGLQLCSVRDKARGGSGVDHPERGGDMLGDPKHR